jgi:hypothetical protein
MPPAVELSRQTATACLTTAAIFRDGEWRMVTNSDVARDLDAVHERARVAFANRDAAAYMAVFHPEVQYTQPGGRTIGHAELARDVRMQLDRVRFAVSEYHREEMEIHSPIEVTEVLEQRAKVRVHAFGILRREWGIQRRGEYDWLRTPDGWRIRRVKVLSERITPRTWVGVR